MNRTFYLLIFFTPILLGMQFHSVPKHHQRLIKEAASISCATDLMNALIILNKLGDNPNDGIAPTLANAQWCIETLSQKDPCVDRLKIAQQLNATLGREWYTEYLKNGMGILDASESLRKAVAAHDKELIAFLLSTGNLYLKHVYETRTLKK